MDWTTDAGGRLSLPGIHDCQIASIEINQGARSVRLRLRSVEDGDTEISCIDIHLLNLTSLWEQTIVSDVRIWAGRASPVNDHSAYTQAWCGLLAGRADNWAEVEQEAVRFIREVPGIHLLAITSSYGGDIHVLCGNVTVNRSSSVDS